VLARGDEVLAQQHLSHRQALAVNKIGRRRPTSGAKRLKSPISIGGDGCCGLMTDAGESEKFAEDIRRGTGEGERGQGNAPIIGAETAL